MDLARTIEDYDLTFLDIETTGLNAELGDTICEIAAIKVRKRREVGRFHSLVNPKRNIPQEAYLIHKISDQDVETAPVFENIADDFISFLENQGEGTVVCAYNIGFDLAFINRELELAKHSCLNLPAVDILRMARRTVKTKRYGLEAIATFYNMEEDAEFHRAIGDSLIASRIFFRLRDTLRKGGIDSLQDFVFLFGMNNAVYQKCKQPKLSLVQQAIDGKEVIKIKYLSYTNVVEEIKIRPLCFFQESRNTYLQYKTMDQGESRVNWNWILDAQAL